MFAFALTLSGAQPARADNYRLYSNATEEGYQTLQTGVFSFHAFAPSTIVSGPDCATFASNGSNFVAFDQWVIENLSGPANQIEFGVSEQCGGYNYLFAAVWQNGGFFPIEVTAIALDTNGHYFDIHRLSSGGNAVWHFAYDGVERTHDNVTWNMAGVRINVGLESSNSGNQVPAHWFSQLQFTQSELPWQAFGTGAPTYILSGGMCGYYVVNYSKWSSGQPGGTC